MIEAYAQDFEAEIAFERYVLERAVPLIEATGPSSTSATIYLDGRPTNIEVGLMTATIGRSLAQAIAELNLRPLLFGAAWKILDVLFEKATASAQSSWHQTIATRVQAVSNGGVKVEPLARDHALWACLCGSYSRLVEYRHSVVHRRLSVGADGSFSVKGLPSFSSTEQVAFCRAVQRAAASVISGTLTTRDRNALGAELDKISTLTGTAPGGFVAAQHPIPHIRVLVTSTTIVDMSSLRAKVASMFPHNREVDVVFEITDDPGLRFSCHLEEAPDLRFALGPSTQFSWLIRS
jgi:hypothetical protein